jgi:hypothetical protein
MSAPASSTAKSPKKSGYDVPWVERYRPEMLEDVVGNEDTLVRLRAIAKDGNMPNLILCGPPGTGKVSSMWGMVSLLPSKQNRLTSFDFFLRRQASTHWLDSCWDLRILMECWNSTLPMLEALM